MILKTCLLLVLCLVWEVHGVSYSNVYVKTGPEVAPAVDYLKYGTPSRSFEFTSPQVAQYASPQVAAPFTYEFPFGQSYSYRTACPSGICVYPEQTISSIAPTSPTANVVTYNAPVSTLPSYVYGRSEPAASYSYVLVNQGAGQDLKLSDGEVIHSGYSFLQPEGLVQYVAEDNQGLNAIFKTYIPNDAVAHTETVHHETVVHESVHHPESCPEAKSEAYTVLESREEEREDPHESAEHEEHNLRHESHESHHESHEPEHGSHESHHGSHESHESHESHHGSHESHESYEPHHESSETHHTSHESHHESGESHHESQESLHESHESHHQSHEARHGGHEEPEIHEYIVHDGHIESIDGSHESGHHSHEDHIIVIHESAEGHHEPESAEHETVHGSHEHHEVEHEGHGHEHEGHEHEHDSHEHEHVHHELEHEGHGHHEVEEEPAVESHESHEIHHTHEAIIEATHIPHESHELHEPHVVAPHVPALVGNNVYISYNDFVKCIQAALARGNTHPIYAPGPTPASPLTYLLFNKPC